MLSSISRYIPSSIATYLTDEERRRLLEDGWMLPISGGDGDDDADSDEDTDTDGRVDQDDDDTDQNSEDDDELDHPDDVLELKRSEYERLRRIAREKDQADKRREREEKKARDKQRKAEGEYEQLLQEKDEEIAQANAERDEARYAHDQYKRSIRVENAARRLGFKDPEDARRFLSDEDTEDDNTTERSLRRLAREKPYLVEARRSSGAPINGDGKVGLTMEQIRNMSEDEINSRWEEVQAAMAAGG